MGPLDFLVIAVILLIIGGAAAYVIRAKKKGQRCIGCPDSGNCSADSGCSGHCASCKSCSQKKED